MNREKVKEILDKTDISGSKEIDILEYIDELEEKIKEYEEIDRIKYEVELERLDDESDWSMDWNQEEE